MDLENNAWKTLEGGYRVYYDASIPLRKLRDTKKPAEEKAIFLDLWENLHHQGDVGPASYLALIELVSICIEKRSLDLNFIGLCLVIENCRIDKHNPELPQEYEALYFNSLAGFERYLLSNFKNITDRAALRLTLALLATLNGQPGLGRAIEKLDEDGLETFLVKNNK